MGFIGKIIGGIFSFLGSLLGVLGKLFGLKKSEYYLELDEAKGETAPAARAPVETAPAAAAPQAAVASKAAATVPEQTPAAVSTGNGNSSADGMTFATDFLVVSTLPRRRRPGPSLSAFKEMAKDMQRR